jgi:predicted dehydrogenase
VNATTAPRRVGILGAGMIAEISPGYLPNLRGLGDRITVVAIASRTRARAEAVAARFEITTVYDDLDDMLAHGNLDIIVNLTPIPAHFETSMKIVEHGVHLVSEKPLAQTAAEADQLCAAADERGVIIVCAPFDMLANEWRNVRRIVRSGAIGRVAFGRVQSSHGGPALMGWPADPRWFYEAGAGPLRDLGVYGLHRITGVLGPAKRVSAFSGITTPTRTARGGPFDGLEFEVTEHDNTVLLLDFGDSCFVTLDATFNVVASRSPQLELYGNAGTLLVHAQGSGSGIELFRLDAAAGTPGWITPTPVGIPQPDRTMELQRGVLVEHLLDCLDTGNPPIASAAHALHVMEIMQAARTSADEGCVVELATTFEDPEDT